MERKRRCCLQHDTELLNQHEDECILQEEILATVLCLGDQYDHVLTCLLLADPLPATVIFPKFKWTFGYS